jgi:integrase
MPRVAIKLTPKPTGGFSARKRIPQDVRVEYERLYNISSEEWFSSGPVTAAEARRTTQEWSAGIETRIANIRAERRGVGLSLSRTQAAALAGEWYSWFVQRHEEAPGDPERWAARWLGVLEDLDDLAPAAVRADQNTSAAWNWICSEVARPCVRPVVADEAQTAQFLASRGLKLSNEARDLFLDFVLPEFLEAVKLLQRRAEGDYSVDKRPKRFPKFTATNQTSSSEMGVWQLFEAYVKAKKLGAATANRWRAVFLDLKKRFEGRSVSSLNAEEAQEWAEQLLTEKRTAATVNDVWCSAASAVFAWAVKQRKLVNNPFKGVGVTRPRKIHTRETKEFNEREIQIILGASLSLDTVPKREFDAACRWVPWLCAYTGARAGEITQLRGTDVAEQNGFWAIQITPEAGSVKAGKPRTVPLHEHLIEQRFNDFVKAKGSGPLFYNVSSKLRAKTDDPTNPVRPRSVKTRERLAQWVRDLGVTDKAIRPNHAWRHTFKRKAARVGIEPRIRDGMCGHASRTVGDEYETPTVEDMAEAMKKFPRYDITLQVEANEEADSV